MHGFFLLRIVLLYPATAMRGVQRYRRLVHESLGDRLTGTGEWPGVLPGEPGRRDRFLIAAGFCLKPYDQNKGGSLCPVGHFNHDCMLLGDAKAVFMSDAQHRPRPCRSCGISPLAKMAADISDKREQTSIDGDVRRRVQHRLDELLQDQDAAKFGGYANQKNIYRFCSAAN